MLLSSPWGIREYIPGKTLLFCKKAKRKRKKETEIERDRKKKGRKEGRREGGQEKKARKERRKRKPPYLKCNSLICSFIQTRFV